MNKLVTGHNIRRLVFTIFLSVIGPANIAFADILTFQKEYTYQASEADSKLSSRTIALEQVKRLLLEELGTYLESETIVKDFKLTKDQVTALTAGIVSAEIIDEKWDGKSYHLKAKISANPGEVVKSIDALRKDREKTKELEELRKKADSALQEIEKLKKELEEAKGAVKGQKQKDYNNAIDGLNTTALFEKAMALWQQNKIREAMDVINKVLEIEPKNFVAYTFLASVNYGLGNKQEAFANINKAIEINPKHGRLYSFRGELYKNAKNYKEAIRDTDKWAELEPDSPVPHIKKGDFYRESGDKQQAIRAYEKAIEIDPKSAEAYFERGRIRLLAKNATKPNSEPIEQAIKDFDKAIELNPNYGAAYIVRGIAYSYLGEYVGFGKDAVMDYLQKAINDHSKALELEHKPEDYIYYSRGEIYYQMGSTALIFNAEKDYTHYKKKAIDDYSKAIELNPKMKEAYLGRAQAYYDLREYNQAIADCDKSIEISPEADAFYFRGRAYYMLDEYKAAINSLNNAINLDSNHGLSYYYRGVIYAYLGAYQKAIRDYSKAIENKITDISYEGRGRAYAALGKYREAIKDFSIIKNYYLLGKAYFALGNYKAAIKDYSKGIEISPDDEKLYYARSAAYTKVGKHKEAISDMKIAARLGHKDARDYLRNNGIEWE